MIYDSTISIRVKSKRPNSGDSFQTEKDDFECKVLVPKGESLQVDSLFPTEVYLADAHIQGEINQVIYLRNQETLKGNCCLYEGSDQNHVNQVVYFASKAKAKMAIVTRGPSSILEIPTLVLSRDDAEFIKELFSLGEVVVIIEELSISVSSPPSSTTDVTLLEDLPSADKNEEVASIGTTSNEIVTYSSSERSLRFEKDLLTKEPLVDAPVTPEETTPTKATPVVLKSQSSSYCFSVSIHGSNDTDHLVHTSDLQNQPCTMLFPSEHISKNDVLKYEVIVSQTHVRENIVTCFLNEEDLENKACLFTFHKKNLTSQVLPLMLNANAAMLIVSEEPKCQVKIPTMVTDHNLIDQMRELCKKFVDSCVMLEVAIDVENHSQFEQKQSAIPPRDEVKLVQDLSQVSQSQDFHEGRGGSTEMQTKNEEKYKATPYYFSISTSDETDLIPARNLQDRPCLLLFPSECNSENFVLKTEVVQADPWIIKQKNFLSHFLNDEMVGKTCLFNQHKKDLITQAVPLAHKAGVAMLVVSKDPEVPVNIPTMVVDHNIVGMIGKCCKDSNVVTLELSDSCTLDCDKGKNGVTVDSCVSVPSAISVSMGTPQPARVDPPPYKNVPLEQAKELNNPDEVQHISSNHTRSTLEDQSPLYGQDHITVLGSENYKDFQEIDSLRWCPIKSIVFPDGYKKDEFLSEITLAIAEPIFYRDVGSIKDLRNAQKLRDHCCVTNIGDTIDNINQIIYHASKAKAKMIIVPRKPTKNKIPTIVLSKENVNAIIEASKKYESLKIEVFRSNSKKSTGIGGKTLFEHVKGLFSSSSVMKTFLEPILENDYGHWYEPEDGFPTYISALEKLLQICKTQHELEVTIKLLQNKKPRSCDVLFFSFCCAVSSISSESKKIPDLKGLLFDYLQHLVIFNTQTPIIRSLHNLRVNYACLYLPPPHILLTESLWEVVLTRKEGYQNKRDQEVLTKALWILMFHCHQSIDSKLLKLHRIVPPEYLENEYENLQKFLPYESLFMLNLSLQKTLKRFCHVFYSFHENDEILILSDQFHQVILEIVKNELHNHQNKELLEDFVLLKNVLSNMKSKCNNDEYKRRIFEFMIDGLGYPIYSSYEPLVEFLSDTSKDNPDHSTIKRSLANHVIKRYENPWNIPTFDETVKLFSTPELQHIFKNRKGNTVLRTYLQNKTSRGSFHDKLLFLDRILGAIIKYQMTNDYDQFGNMISSIICTELDIKRIVTLCNCAMTGMDIFCFERNTLTFDLNEAIADNIFSGSSILSRSPRLVWRILEMLGKNETPAPQSLHYYLFQSCKEYLLKVADDPERTATFCKWLIDSTKLHCQATFSMFDEVVLASFDRLNINEFGDLLVIDCKPLSDLMECLRYKFDENTESPREKHIRVIEGIVDDWVKRYNGDKINLFDLTKVINCVKGNHKRRKIITDLNSGFPTDDDMISMKNDFKETQEGICSLLTIEMNDQPLFSIYQIFEKYQVKVGTSDRMGQVLWRYQVHIENFLRQKPVKLDDMELTSLKSDEKYMVDFHREHRKELSIAYHFLQNPSILFKNELNILGFSQVSEDLNVFLKQIKEISEKMGSYLNTNTTYETILEYVLVINKEHGIISKEMEVVINCPELSIPDQTQTFFDNVFKLESIKSPLTNFVVFCKQFRFSLVNDVYYKNIETINSELDSDDVKSWSMSTCSEKVSTICEILGCEVDDLTDEIFYLEVFEKISSCNEVWLFLEESKWFGKKGLNRFYDEYRNVTNCRAGLGEASFEMNLLDCLEPVVRCVATVEALKDCTDLHKFMITLKEEPDIVKEVESRNRFESISAVQQNIVKIREWFVQGTDDLALIMRQFEAICTSGVFTVESDMDPEEKGHVSAILHLRFEMIHQNERKKTTMVSTEIDEFILSLGFIQHDNIHIRDSIKEFIEKYQTISEVSKQMICMIQLGYCLDPTDVKYTPRTDLSEIKEHLAKYTEMNKDCHKWLTDVREKHPLSLLFWIEELQHISKLLNDARDSDQSLESLMDTISRVTLTESLDDVIHSKHDLMNAAKRTLRVKSIFLEKSWLLQISSFIEMWYRSLNNIRTASSPNESSETFLHIHTFNLEDITSNEACLFMLKHIYVNRLPKEFEVLDGLNQQSDENFNIFFHRAKSFPAHTFTVLNVESLSLKQQESIMEFLSSWEKANIHFVQNGTTLLRPSPWVKENLWDDSKLVRSFGNVPSMLRDVIVERRFINEVTVVGSPNACSGKTEYIRNSIHDHTKMVTLTVHEGTTFTSLIESISTKVSQIPIVDTIYFSFTFDIGDENCQVLKDLLCMLNHFFVSFLILHSIYDSKSKLSFKVKQSGLKIYVELPSISSNMKEDPKVWLLKHIPVLSSCCIFADPPNDMNVDERMRRVGIYLRAYEDGTINRKFEESSKRIVFVIDKSGSMAASVGIDRHGTSKSCIDLATDNMLSIFDSHILTNDFISLVLFDHDVHEVIPLQLVQSDTQKANLRQNIDLVRHSADGGTSMYTALKHVLVSLENETEKDIAETWIVTLTDGASADNPSVMIKELQRSSEDTHVVIIGVNLSSGLHQQMNDLTKKYGNESSNTKGFFLPTTAHLSAIDDAFARVAASIPVSQTFELDGELNDVDCIDYINKYVPTNVPMHNKLLRKFFVEFMYRRVKVFDENEDFNYNEKHDRLGSSLIEVMLEEVQQFLSVNQDKNWSEDNHHQLIYDFSGDSPQFRLICTSPDQIPPDVREKLEELDLPGFRIPTTNELQKMETLYLYLSQSLNIPYDELKELIEKNKFVLTLDFTMKILNIHERVQCLIPCIIEGETGVSKSALTKMYSVLMNHSLQSFAKKATDDILLGIESQVLKRHNPTRTDDDDDDDSLTKDKLLKMILQEPDEVSKVIFDCLKEACESREAFFSSLPEEFSGSSFQSKDDATRLLKWFSKSEIECTFFELDVDSSLTEKDIVSFFDKVRKVSQRLAHTEALIVVFLDEINTSSILGLFKEIVIDHSICGERFENNIVIVAAANPSRTKSTTRGGVVRENDLGKDWASGHYQVNKLPNSMANLKWDFGSLNPQKEKEFIYRRMKIIDENIPNSMQCSLTELISKSQEIIRSFAEEHIFEGLQRLDPHNENNRQDAQQRARSVVSLRDIQRVFSLFDFLQEFCKRLYGQTNKNMRQAMLLTIAVVYYLRLSPQSREKFVQEINNLPTEKNEKITMKKALSHAMEEVIKLTDIPNGIAMTRGLKENIFMTIVCSLSLTPLMIIGPPGSSKTLSVNIVTDNASGQESSREFYREYSRLQPFHYQCSKASTSKEVASIFKLAINRQEKVDPKKQLCMVFMDEAGLPEEEKESLKVLHYYLEGHMSKKATVAFVGITNHVLDAAKSNRCVSLLRSDPDKEELNSICKGVMFDFRAQSCEQDHVSIDKRIVSVDEFSASLCKSYISLKKKFDWFESFFGMRDFIYFLKSLKQNSSNSGRTLVTSTILIMRAFERNFSGIDGKRFLDLSFRFLNQICGVRIEKENVLKMRRHPVSLINEALSLCDQPSGEFQERYKLIIDESDDDSIMRLLNMSGCLSLSAKHSLFKLSCMPDNCAMEKLNLISGVKFAALQGVVAVLSQTDSINESFYDLFNLHFRSLSRGGQVYNYANIAVGSTSTPCLIHDNFRCVVHIRKSDLDHTPTAFLNRFEKYVLSVKDVLEFILNDFPGLQKIVLASKIRVMEFQSLIQEKGIYGWNEQTLLSIFVQMLRPHIENTNSQSENNTTERLSFGDLLYEFLTKDFMSLEIGRNDVAIVIQTAITCLPYQYSNELKQLCKVGKGIDQARIKETFVKVMQSNNENTSLATLSKILFHMTITRTALLRLLKITTPESIFANRRSLPSEILQEYFCHDHFCLKKHLHMIHESGAYRKHIIFSRTECVSSLPSWNYGTHTDQNKYEMIKALVYEDPEDVVVLNLSSVKSEASLRSSIESWINDETKKLFLLIIEMNSTNSVSTTNFVRSLVENFEYLDKSIVLLLHFPPTSSNCCYPALFLGNWDFFFLDGNKSDSKTVDVKPWIKFACGISAENNESVLVKESFSIMLPNSLIHASSLGDIFETSSSIFADKGTYQSRVHARFEALSNLMKYDFGDETIESILYERFRNLFSEDILSRILANTSKLLLDGMSQLPLSSSVISVLQDVFDSFLMYYLNEMKKSFTPNILSRYEHCSDTNGLVKVILQQLPLPPFQELLLYGCNNIQSISRSPQQPKQTDPDHAIFPFFHIVSSYLDESLEKAYADTTRNSSHEIDSQIKLTLQDIKQYVPFESSETSERNQLSCREKLIGTVVDYCKISYDENNESLFLRYLRQYLHWKIGCKSDSIILQWIMEKIERIWESDPSELGNIKCIHLVCKNNEMDLIQLASWTYSDSFYAIENIPTFREASNCNYLEQVITSFVQTLPIHALKQKESIFDNLFSHISTIVSKENNLSSSYKSKDDWIKNFFNLWHRLPEILGEPLHGQSILNTLRVLTFLYILIKTDAAEEIVEYSIDRFYNRDLTSLNSKVQQLYRESSLDLFLHTIYMEKVNSSWRDNAIFQMLGLFFSPSWLQLTLTSESADLEFLCSFLKSNNDDCNKNLKTIARVSMKNICLCLEPNGDSFYGIPRPIIEIIGSDLTGTTRERGFLPRWFFKEDDLKDRLKSDPDEFYDLNRFLSTNWVVLNDPLMETLFEIVLVQLADSIRKSSLTSENIMLSVESDIQALYQENENGGEVVFQRLYITARLICFITKVAQELMLNHESDVLTGLYHERGSRILEAFLRSDLCWSRLFFSTMLRLKGEGYVYLFLKESNTLTNLVPQEWLAGIPTENDALVHSLQQAEQKLQEATNDEMRKAREFRLCPHCNREFGVAAMNCGQFTCGRIDRHNSNGPNLGCGQPFQYNQARDYNIDNEKLSMMQQEVDRAKESLRENEIHSLLWEEAKATEMPILLFDINHIDSCESFLPSACLTKQMELILSNTESESPLYNSCQLLKCFVDNLHEIDHYQGLSYMVEFYLWLNTTFKYLITEEKALEIQLSSLMKEEVLRKRFDDAHVHHILELWKCVCRSVNNYLKAVDFKIHWDCEEVRVPFRSIDDTNLMMLLSEKSHPSEGYDYLFLIMNDIASKYNKVVMKINQIIIPEPEKEETVDIDPRRLVDCRKEKLGLFNARLSKTIQHLVECFWKPNEEVYDIESLVSSLKLQLGISSTIPCIQNMTSSLREQFRFRILDDSTGVDNFNRCIVKSSEGDLFVRANDAQLFESVKQTISLHGLDPNGQPDIRSTINTHFHSLEYEDLRQTLGGIRNVLHILYSEDRTIGVSGGIRQNMMTFKEAVSRASKKDEISRAGIKPDKGSLYGSFGFPVLSNAQYDMLEMFTLNGIVEMVFYLGKQLAGENFLFSKHPLRFKEELSLDVCDQIKKSTVYEMKNRGGQEVANELNIFITEVLDFYATEILKDKNSGAVPNDLLSFLKENNFCDESDPIFALLPKDKIKIQNYVSLRQELYQLRLFVLQREQALKDNVGDSLQDNLDEDEKGNCTFYKKTERGSCWLWSQSEEEQVGETYESAFIDDDGFDSSCAMSVDTLDESDEEEIKPTTSQYTTELWFEQVDNEEREKDEMVKYLSETRVPMAIQNKLIEYGAQSMMDLCMIVEEMHEIIQEIPKLSVMKIERAIEKYKEIFKSA